MTRPRLRTPLPCPDCGLPRDHVHLSPAAGALRRAQSAKTVEVPVPLPMQEAEAYATYEVTFQEES